MQGTEAFSNVAPYLTNPLVLLGFLLLLVFAVQRALLGAGIIPQLAQRTGGRVVQSLLRYGFVIALVVIILGFLLAFYRAREEHSPRFQTGQAEKARIDGLVAAANGYCHQFEKPS